VNMILPGRSLRRDGPIPRGSFSTPWSARPSGSRGSSTAVKLRARQTAEIWAEYLPDIAIVEGEDLDPKAPSEIWRERLGGETDDVLLVGHLPHLARLAALLLCGNDGRDVVMVQNAGLICLEQRERGGWSLRWALTPEIV
jgi:phosphohistidine phosphatase